MYLTDLFKQILFSLWMHKLRTCLALFGIIWGTVAVVLLLALSDSFYHANIKNLAFLNNGTIMVWPGVTSKPFAGLPQGQRLHIRIQDLLNIMHTLPYVKTFSPVFTVEGEVRYEHKRFKASINGVSAGFQEIQQVVPLSGGSFINPIDEANGNRVVFLDTQVKNTLFGDKDAIGKMITINGIPFYVIGVKNPKAKGMMIWMSKFVYVPYTTALALWGQRDVNFIYVQPDDVQHAAYVKQGIKNLLAMKYKFDPTDKQAVMIPDTEDAQVFFKWFFRIIELFLGCCGALTLSVGGLGIANMMFLIVTERTREIGLRMALGAEQIHIMLQFMLETLLLVNLGGVIGFFISWCCISFLQHMPLPEWLGSPQFSWLTIMITTLILATVGMIAGYFPARRAANMEPVLALAF